MVNLRLKKSDASKRLLPSQRQGFFGKKMKKYARSEEERFEKENPYEAPGFLDTPESSSSNNTEDSPVHHIVTTKESHGDNETHMSDITADRTYKRAVEQFQLQQQESQENSLPVVPETGANCGGMIAVDPPGDVAETSQPDPVSTPVVSRNGEMLDDSLGNNSFITRIFGAVDEACTTKESPDQVQKVLSFSPEWGVAPEDDGTATEYGPTPLAEWKPPETYSIALSRDPTSLETGPVASVEPKLQGRESPPPTAMTKAVEPKTPPPRPVTPTFDSERTESPSSSHLERFELVLDEKNLQGPNSKRKVWLPFRKAEGKQTSNIAKPSVTKKNVVQTPVSKKAPQTPPTAKMTPQGTKSAKKASPGSRKKSSPKPSQNKVEPKVQVRSRKAMLAAAKVAAKKQAEAKKMVNEGDQPSQGTASPTPTGESVEQTPTVTEAKEIEPKQKHSPRLSPVGVPSADATDVVEEVPSQEETEPAKNKDAVRPQKTTPAKKKDTVRQQKATTMPPTEPVVEPDEYKAKPKKGFLQKVRSLTKEKKELSGTDKQRQAQKEDTPKEARLKQVLVAFHGAAQGPLPSIDEEEEDSDKFTPTNEATELKVRVPGGTYLSDGDLIGEEVVDENEGINEHTDEPETSRSVSVPGSSENLSPDRKLSSHETSSVFREKADPPTAGTAVEGADATLIRNNKSWKERLGITKSHSNAEETPPQSPDVRRLSSAPSKAAGVDNPKPKKKKSQWKETKDPASGRVYYYHRVSRKTTWIKPKELESREPESEVKMPVEGSNTQKSPKAKGLRKNTKRDFDPVVWEKKEKIAEMLETMEPPDGESVERLMTKYEGNEDELLMQLRDVKESRPFDEPMGATNETGSLEGSQAAEDPVKLAEPQSFRSRTQTALSFRSGASGITRLSEKTPQIKNTSKGGRAIVPIREDQSHATSISSKGNLSPLRPSSTLNRRANRRAQVPTNIPVPGKIPVPRSRELQVEELSDGFRRNNIRGVVRSAKSKNHSGRAQAMPSTGTLEQPPSAKYANDSTAEADNASTVNDDVSALSMTDTSFIGSSPEQEAARRRAFDDAVAREDWDLAAALSEGMKALKKRDAGNQARTPSPGEWTQTELDRYISENDWDAVAKYIAKVRELNKKSAPKARGRPPRDDGVNSEDDSQVRKRFGARSQLQHPDLHSYSSWDSSSYYESDDYSSAQSYSSDERAYRRQNRRRRGNEFAC